MPDHKPGHTCQLVMSNRIFLVTYLEAVDDYHWVAMKVGEDWHAIFVPDRLLFKRRDATGPQAAVKAYEEADARMRAGSIKQRGKAK